MRCVELFCTSGNRVVKSYKIVFLAVIVFYLVIGITMNSTTTTTLPTTTTTPLPVFNPNWLSQLFVANKTNVTYNLTGLILETIILIISFMKKRQAEQTYRIIILYQVCAAMAYDGSGFLTSVVYSIFTCTYVAERTSLHLLKACNKFKLRKI